MKTELVFWAIVIACCAILATVGCKAIQNTSTTEIVHPDGKIERTTTTTTDNSFTLGMPEGPGKTIVGGNLLDLNVSGASL